MDNDTYVSNSDVIKKLDDLSAAVGGTTVPTTTTKTNTDFVIGINKSIDAASGRTGVEYPPYSHNTLVTDKLDELAEAIAEGGGGGPGPTPVMGALSVTENGDYLPSTYDYDGFSSVSVDVSTPTPVMGALSVTENGDYLPSSYNYDGFSSVSVDVPAPTPSLLPVKVLDNGEISTESSYATANFTESIANYEYIVVIFRRYLHESDVSDESHDYRGFVMKVSDIVEYLNTHYETYYPYSWRIIANGFDRTISGGITLTSINSYNYSGAYNKLCCDVYAYPTGLLRYPN